MSAPPPGKSRQLAGTSRDLLCRRQRHGPALRPPGLPKAEPRRRQVPRKVTPPEEHAGQRSPRGVDALPDTHATHTQSPSPVAVTH